MLRVLIFGVSGQVGSYCADRFLAEGFEVVGTVRRRSVSNNSNISHITSEKFSVKEADVTDGYSVQNLIDYVKPSYVINCAANSGVESSWGNPIECVTANSISVIHQLESIRKSCPYCHYLNFGSSEEFDLSSYYPQNEKTPLKARNPYGASKIASRSIINSYKEKYNLYAVQPWCFNFTSPRHSENFFISKLVKSAAKFRLDLEDFFNGGKMPNPVSVGNINHKRDWSHAEDVVDAIFKILNQDKFSGRDALDYVISSGTNISVRKVIESVFAEFGIFGLWYGKGCEEKLCFTHHNQEVVICQIDKQFYRADETGIYVGDSSKLKQDLNWKPKYNFETLIKSLVHGAKN